MLWAQHILPTGNPHWFLSACFRSKRGSCHDRFESAAVDSLLEELYLTKDQGNIATILPPPCYHWLKYSPVGSVVGREREGN